MIIVKMYMVEASHEKSAWLPEVKNSRKQFTRTAIFINH